jgi:hypothetical protein
MYESATPSSSSSLLSSSQQSSFLSARLQELLSELLVPLLTQLDTHVDCRLVRTLADTVISIIRLRHRNCGLLLSELGAYLCGPAHAPAGTKRLSNLLRSPNWTASEIADYLWAEALKRQQALQQAGNMALLVWDDSRLEKPESLMAQGLCPVRSSKAGRLTHMKPGYYQPPTSPIFVPGFHWTALIVLGRTGPPSVAAMRWWSTRSAARLAQAPEASTDTPYLWQQEADETWLSNAREQQLMLMQQCHDSFGNDGALVCHIFDRGYAGTPWLQVLSWYQAPFIMRWPKRYPLLSSEHKSEEEQHKKEQHSEDKAVPAWQHTRGLRSWGHRMMPDTKRQGMCKTGVLVVPVRHVAYRHEQEQAEGKVVAQELGSLWLVVARQAGREPWYLLTNRPVETEEDAWRVVQDYARRWQIEMALRFSKSELAMESPRLWSWERRLKLLMIATLVYAFLLRLLREPKEWIQQILRAFCHRTGERSRENPAPLYRLRTALCQLWLVHPPPTKLYKSSG